MSDNDKVPNSGTDLRHMDTSTSANAEILPQDGCATTEVIPTIAGRFTLDSRCSCESGTQGLDADGYCEGCGVRLARPASDHREQQICEHLAAVSDRGLVHRRNEDSFALAKGKRGHGVVVCDGVSSTRRPEVASHLVASAVRNAFEAFLKDDDSEDAASTMQNALAAAAKALREEEGEFKDDQAPSTTVVAALMVGREVTLGWAGDSRAYWISATEATALTRDHSVRVEEGSGPEQAGESARYAHTITRWLGADAEAQSEPEIRQLSAASGGTLLLCSDGVWNHLDQTQTFFAAVQRCAQGSTGPLGLAQNLVAFANVEGGQDNATVAILQVSPPSRLGAPPDAATEPTHSDERREITGESNVDSVQG